MKYVPNFLKRNRGKILASILTAATISGTFFGHKDDLPPLYVRKTGNSYGINIAGFTNFEKGSKHYGLSISIIDNFAGGMVNGGEFSLFRFTEISEDLELLKPTSELNGFGLNLAGVDLEGRLELNGLAVGIINQAGNGKHVQLGIYNSSGNTRPIHRGLIFNQNFTPDGDPIKLKDYRKRIIRNSEQDK